MGKNAKLIMLLRELPLLGKPKMKYISSTHKADGKHRDFYTIKPNEKHVLAEINEPGVISSIWLTVSSPDRRILKKLILRMYWDGEEKPSVEAPLGDFFGLCFGEYIHYNALPLGATSGGYYCYFPMPFEKGRN